MLQFFILFLLLLLLVLLTPDQGPSQGSLPSSRLVKSWSLLSRAITMAGRVGESVASAAHDGTLEPVTTDDGGLSVVRCPLGLIMVTPRKRPHLPGALFQGASLLW